MIYKAWPSFFQGLPFFIQLPATLYKKARVYFNPASAFFLHLFGGYAKLVKPGLCRVGYLGAEYDAAYPGPVDGAKTHRAWLCSGIHNASRKIVCLKLLRSYPYGIDFRVASSIFFKYGVPGDSHYLAGLNYTGAERASAQSPDAFLGRLHRQLHIFGI